MTSVRLSDRRESSPGWRIVTITFTAPPGLPGLRQSTINTIRAGETTGPWAGWEFEVDRDSLLMISPPGWVAGRTDRDGDKVTVYEVAKGLAAIAWEYAPPVADHGADRDGLGQPLRWRDGAGEAVGRVAGIAEYIPANEATIAAAVAAAGPQAFASPLPAPAPVERDEPPDEPVVPVRRGPGRPRKTP